MLLRRLNGNQVLRLRRWLRQGIGLRFILPVGAGQPLPVLPQVLLLVGELPSQLAMDVGT